MVLLISTKIYFGSVCQVKFGVSTAQNIFKNGENVELHYKISFSFHPFSLYRTITLNHLLNSPSNKIKYILNTKFPIIHEMFVYDKQDLVHSFKNE